MCYIDFKGRLSSLFSLILTIPPPEVPAQMVPSLYFSRASTYLLGKLPSLLNICNESFLNKQSPPPEKPNHLPYLLSTILLTTLTGNPLISL